MKKFTFFASIIFLAFAIALFAKEDFTVFAVKGELMLQKNGKGNWTKLNTGSKISASDNLKVADGAYVSLIHSSGKTMEIKQSGVYSASKLSTALQNKKSSLSARVANYVLSQVQSSGDLLSKENYQQNMGVTGAVERGINAESPTGRESSVANDRKPVFLTCPLKQSVNTDEITLSWRSINPKSGYVFHLLDRFDKEILVKDVNLAKITLNFKDLKLEKDTFYFWFVTFPNDNKPSDKACFSFVSDKKIKEVDNEVAKLKSDFTDSKSAVSQFLLGAYYEEKNMIAEAGSYYKKCLEIAPDVPEYQKYYENFLRKYNLNF